MRLPWQRRLGPEPNELRKNGRPPPLLLRKRVAGATEALAADGQAKSGGDLGPGRPKHAAGTETIFGKGDAEITRVTARETQTETETGSAAGIATETVETETEDAIGSASQQNPSLGGSCRLAQLFMLSFQGYIARISGSILALVSTSLTSSGSSQATSCGNTHSARDGRLMKLPSSIGVLLQAYRQATTIAQP